MENIVQSPVFGVFLTVATYFLAGELYKRYRYIFLNPVLISTVFIIFFLSITDIDFETYNQGGSLLSFFLGPSIVALGVFLYEKFEEIKKNVIPFLFAVAAGGLMSMLSMIFILMLFNVPGLVVRSLVSKSVTAPIAVEITRIIGGYPEITAGIVIAVGIFGNAFGPALLKFMGIKSKAALGAALGTASHGIGTARALEEGKSPGVYSGLAMCINGIITAVSAPYLIELL